jgi:hypothetical protein
VDFAKELVAREGTTECVFSLCTELAEGSRPNILQEEQELKQGVEWSPEWVLWSTVLPKLSNAVPHNFNQFVTHIMHEIQCRKSGSNRISLV